MSIHIQNIIKRIDTIGINIWFNFQGQFNIKSIFGGLLSIVFVAITASLFLGFGIDLYQRKNPKTSFNTMITDYEEVPTSNSKFTLAFRLEDTFGQFFNKSDIAYIQVYYFKFIQSSIGEWSLDNYTITDPVKCSNLSNYKEKEEQLSISLSQWYCFNFDNNITLGGSWAGNYVNGIQIISYQCKDEFKGGKCAPKEKVISSFQNNITGSGLFYSFLYMDSLPTLDDFSSPINQTLTNSFEMLNLQTTKRSVQYLKTVGVNTDNGWLFSDNSLKYIYSSDYISTDFSMKSEWDQNVVYNHFIYLGTKKEIYSRSYTKVQEIFAQIGGFLKFFDMLLGYFYSYFSLLIGSNEILQTIPNFETNTKPFTNNRPEEEYSPIGIKKINPPSMNSLVKLNNPPNEEKANKLSLCLYLLCNKKDSTEVKKLLSFSNYFMNAFSVNSYLTNFETIQKLNSTMSDSTKDQTSKVIHSSNAYLSNIMNNIVDRSRQLKLFDNEIK